MTSKYKDRHQPVTINSETVEFVGFRKVVTYDFQLDDSGITAKHEMVICREASAVVIYDPALEKLVMIRQFRLGAQLCNGRGMAIELAAGLIDDGESPEDSAKREMLEETGLKASRMEKLCTYLSTPGLATETIHLFYAEADASNLTESSGLASESEQTFPFLISPQEAMAAVEQGDISNGIALMGLMWFSQHREKLTGKLA